MYAIDEIWAVLVSATYRSHAVYKIQTELSVCSSRRGFIKGY